MQTLFPSAKQCREHRADNMRRARACKKALIDGWGCGPDSEEVKDGVGFWVRRARTWHGYAMGRLPLLDNFVVIHNGHITEGAVYAEGSKQP